MGYIGRFEQEKVFKLYGKVAKHRCDNCHLPIFEDEAAKGLLYADSKAGHVEIDYGNQTRPEFLPKFDYKVTYHKQCSTDADGKPLKLVQDKKQKPAKKDESKPVTDGVSSSARIKKTREKILEAIKAKPRKEYWTVGMLFKKVFPDMPEKKKGLVRQVVRDMRADRSLIRKGGCLYLPKKGNK